MRKAKNDNVFAEKYIDECSVAYSADGMTLTSFSDMVFDWCHEARLITRGSKNSTWRIVFAKK